MKPLLGGLGEPLGSPWGGLGGSDNQSVSNGVCHGELLGSLGEPLGGLGEVLGRFPLGGLGELLGASWRHLRLGAPRRLLRGIWTDILGKSSHTHLRNKLPDKFLTDYLFLREPRDMHEP